MPRGGARTGAGRPKGSPNKITSEVRAALKLLVDENVGEMRTWFKKQWATDDGGKVAANLLSRLIEFSAPKLHRTDQAPGVDGQVSPETPMPSLADFFQTVTRISAGDDALPAPQSTEARSATAADFGMPEPDPAPPRALPQPEPGSLLERVLRAPLPSLEQRQEAIVSRSEPPQADTPAAAPAQPLEGEVLDRDRQADLAAFQAEFESYQRRVDEYTASERERLGKPFYNVTERELKVVLGPRPVNPAFRMTLRA